MPSAHPPLPFDTLVTGMASGGVTAFYQSHSLVAPQCLSCQCTTVHSTQLYCTDCYSTNVVHYNVEDPLSTLLNCTVLSACYSIQLLNCNALTLYSMQWLHIRDGHAPIFADAHRCASDAHNSLKPHQFYLTKIL